MKLKPEKKLKLFTSTLFVAATMSTALSELNAADAYINFDSGHGQGWLYGQAASVVWNNTSGATGTLADIKDETGNSIGASLSWTSPGVWNWSDTSVAGPLRGYLDDSWSAYPVIQVTTSYLVADVTIYCSTDSGSNSFQSKTVNGITYTFKDGNLVQGSGSWGSRDAYAIEGKNMMTIKGVNGSSIEIKGGDRADPARGSIAAIKISDGYLGKKVSAELSDASIDWSNTKFGDLAWTNSSAENPAYLAVSNFTQDTSINVTGDVIVTDAITVNGSGVLTFTGKAVKLIGPSVVRTNSAGASIVINNTLVVTNGASISGNLSLGENGVLDIQGGIVSYGGAIPTAGEIKTVAGSAINFSTAVGEEFDISSLKVTGEGSLGLSMNGGNGTTLKTEDSISQIRILSGRLRASAGELYNTKFIVSNGAALVFAENKEIANEVSVEGGIEIHANQNVTGTMKGTLSGGTVYKRGGGVLNLRNAIDLENITTTSGTLNIYGPEGTGTVKIGGLRSDSGVTETNILSDGGVFEFIRQTGKTVNVGDGTTEIKVASGQFAGTAHGAYAGTFNIKSKAILTITGTAGTTTSGNAHSFQIAHWGATQTVNVEGTLNMAHVGFGTKDGNGDINVVTGGELNMNAGLEAVSNKQNNVVRVHLKGGEMNIGGTGITDNSVLSLELDSGTVGSLSESWSTNRTLSLGQEVDFNTTLKTYADGAKAAATDQGSTITLAGKIEGTGILKKSGLGELVLSGQDSSYSGGTKVTAGTLVASGTSSVGTGELDIGGETAVVRSTSENALGSANVVVRDKGVLSLENASSMTGGLTVNTNGKVLVEVAGITGVGAIALNEAIIQVVRDGILSTEKALISSNSTITSSGSVDINILSGVTAGSKYIILEGSDLSGINKDNFKFSITEGARPAASTFSVENNKLFLTIGEGGAANLVWNGTSTDAVWIANDSNKEWKKEGTSTADSFYQADSVIFDGTATNNTVALGSDVAPGAITVKGTTPIVINSGNYKITGTASLTLESGSKLSLNGKNDYTGATSIADNASLSLGLTSSELHSQSAINGTGTLELNVATAGTTVLYSSAVKGTLANTLKVQKTGAGVLDMTGTSLPTEVAVKEGTLSNLTATGATGTVIYGEKTGQTLGTYDKLTLKDGAVLTYRGFDVLATSTNLNLGAAFLNIENISSYANTTKSLGLGNEDLRGKLFIKGISANSYSFTSAGEIKFAETITSLANQDQVGVVWDASLTKGVDAAKIPQGALLGTVSGNAMKITDLHYFVPVSLDSEDKYFQNLGGGEKSASVAFIAGTTARIGLAGVQSKESVTRDIWLAAAGGEYTLLLGGAMQGWDAYPVQTSITGNLNVQVCGSTNVDYVVGGNLLSDGGNITGNTGVVIEGASIVNYSVIGGSTSKHNTTGLITGNTSVVVKNVQSTQGTAGPSQGLITDAIVGGSAYHGNTTSKTEVTGNTSVLIDLASSASGDFVKKIIGASTSGTNANTTSVVNGDSSVTINAPDTVSFKGIITAGGYSAGGTSTVKGNASLTLNGGTYAADIYVGGYGLSTYVGGNTTLTINRGVFAEGITISADISTTGNVVGTRLIDVKDTLDLSKATLKGFDTLNIADGKTLTVGKLAQGNWKKSGTGTLVFSDNVEAGAIQISADTGETVFRIGDGKEATSLASFENANAIKVETGTLNLSGNASFSGGAEIAQNASVAYIDDNVTSEAKFTGTGTLAYKGTGTMTYAQNFSGNLKNLSSGTLNYSGTLEKNLENSNTGTLVLTGTVKGEALNSGAGTLQLGHTSGIFAALKATAGTIDVVKVAGISESTTISIENATLLVNENIKKSGKVSFNNASLKVAGTMLSTSTPILTSTELSLTGTNEIYVTSLFSDNTYKLIQLDNTTGIDSANLANLLKLKMNQEITGLNAEFSLDSATKTIVMKVTGTGVKNLIWNNTTDSTTKPGYSEWTSTTTFDDGTGTSVATAGSVITLKENSGNSKIFLTANASFSKLVVESGNYEILGAENAAFVGSGDTAGSILIRKGASLTLDTATALDNSIEYSKSSDDFANLANGIIIEDGAKLTVLRAGALGTLETSRVKVEGELYLGAETGSNEAIRYGAVELRGESSAGKIFLGYNGEDSAQLSSFIGTETSTGKISGKVSLIKTGTGTLVFDSPQSYEGETIVRGGTLKINGIDIHDGDATKGNFVVETAGTLDLNGAQASFVNSKIILAGGTLTNTGAKSTGNYNISLTADSKIGGDKNAIEMGGTLPVDTNLDLGGHTLVKQGANYLTLKSTSITAGTLDVQGGTVELTSYTAAESAKFKLATGTTLSGSSAAQIGEINAEAGSEIKLGGGLTIGALNTDSVIAGTLSGTTSLTKTGTGVLTLSGDISYSGGTSVAGGTLKLLSERKSNTGTVTVEADGTLDLSDKNAAIYQKGNYASLNMTVKGTLKVYNYSYDGSLGALRTNGNGTKSLLLDGGTLVLTNTHDNKRGTDVSSAGATILAEEGVVVGFEGNNNGKAFTTTGGVLKMGGSGSILLKGGDYGSITGSAQVEKIGSGSLVFRGDNEYTGGTKISEGSLEVSSAKALGTGATLLDAENASLVHSAGSNSVVLSGATKLLKGTLSFENIAENLAQDFAFFTVADSASLELGNTLNLNFVYLNEGTYRLFKGASITGWDALKRENITNNGVALDDHYNVTFSNADSFKAITVAIQSFDLTWKGGDGEWNFVDKNTWNPVDGKNLAFLNGDSVRFASSGTITLGAALSPTTIVVGADDKSKVDLSFVPATGTFNGIYGNTTITIKDGASLTLNSAHSYTGNTVLEENAKLILDIASGKARFLNSTIGGKGSVELKAGSDLSFASVMKGAHSLVGDVSLVKTGTGTLSIDVANSYTGGTTISEGKLLVANKDALGTGTITNNASLEYQTNMDITIVNAISGTGSLIKTGTGNLTLTQGIASTGKTTIAEGKLTLQTASDTLLQSQIDGDGTLVKTGSGKLTLATGTSLKSYELEEGTLAGISTEFASIKVTTGTLEALQLRNGKLVRTGESFSIAGTSSITDSTIELGTLSDSAAITLSTGADLTLSNVTFNLSGVSLAATTGTPVIYKLIDASTGTLTGWNSLNVDNLTFDGKNARVEADFSQNGEVAISSKALDLLWNGGNGVWNTTAESWNCEGEDYAYMDHDRVRFENSANILLASDVAPEKITIGKDAQIVIAGLARKITGASSIALGQGANLELDVGFDYTGTTTLGDGSTLRLKLGEPENLVRSTLNSSIRPQNIGGDIVVDGSAVLALDVSDGSSVKFGDVIAKDAAANLKLTKEGAGTLDLDKITKISGADLQEGTLRISKENAIGNGIITSAKDTNLEVDFNGKFENALTGQGTLVKIGDGKVSLTGTNTFTGKTEILAGTLHITTADALKNSEGIHFGSSTAKLEVDTDEEFSRPLISSKDGYGTLLVETASGSTAKLSGDNSTFSGNVVLKSNTQARTAEVFGTGTVQIEEGKELTYTAGANGTAANNFAGTGSLKIESQIKLDGDSSAYSGTLTNTGTITVANDKALGTGTLDNKGEVIFLGENSGNVSTNITGNGRLVKEGAGELTLTGRNSYTGETLVNAGTLNASSASALGKTAGIKLADSSELKLSLSGAEKFDRSISGKGKVSVVGGQLDLRTANDFSGDFSAEKTELTISTDNVFGSGNVALKDTKVSVKTAEFTLREKPFVLSGNSEFRAGNFFVKSSQAAGSSITLQSVGIEMSGGKTTLIVTLDDKASAETPHFTGSGIIDVSGVDLVVESYIGDETSFALTDANVGLQGSFNSISVNGATASGLHYDPATGMITTEGLELAKDKGYSALVVMPTEMFNRDIVNLRTRLEQRRYETSAGQDWEFFAQGRSSNVSNGKNASKSVTYDYSTYGALVGADLRLGPTSLIGIALGYDRGDSKLHNGNGKIDMDDYRITVYGGEIFQDRFFIDAGAQFGCGSYEIKRRGNSDAKGDTNGWNLGVFATAGALLTISEEHYIYATPYVGFSYMHSNVDAFTETGSDLTLIDSYSADSLRSRIGFNASHLFSLGEIGARLGIDFAYSHEFLDDKLDANKEQCFMKDMISVGANIDLKLSGDTGVFFGYSADLGFDSEVSHNVNAGIRFSF